ncbi:MAG: hypothetical protein Q7R31_03915 [Candidatus Levybacteria bacterium]|nr:hypothetical protein [Candidatus Levybacteria bacterium]
MLGILNKYKLLAVLAVAILAIAIPVTIIQVQKQQEIRQRASTSAVSLQFVPNTITKSINDSFSVDINLINTDSPKDISAVDVTINYNSILGLVGVFQPAPGFDAVVNETTASSIHYIGTAPNDSHNNGAAIKLGSLTFKGNSAGAGNVSFGNILVTASGVSDALAIDTSNNNTGTYTITSGAAGSAPASAPPAAIKYDQQCILNVTSAHCGEQPTSDCIQQYSNDSSCKISSTATSGTVAAPGSTQCTANGNWCSGVTPVGKGNCTPAPGFSCNNSFDLCWHCDVLAPTPGQASTSSSPGGGRSSGGNGASSSYRIEPTSVPSGYVTLYFNVTLPGFFSTLSTAPITVTLIQGSSPVREFPNISLTTRQPNGNVFTGDSGTKIRASDITSGQDYYVEVKAQSYQKKIITGGEQKNLQGLRALGNNYSLPAITLLSGDINDDGDIGGADLGIIIACFGNKNVLTDSAGRNTECASKRSNLKFDADINKDGKVAGDDINLWARGSNGVL